MELHKAIQRLFNWDCFAPSLTYNVRTKMWHVHHARLWNIGGVFVEVASLKNIAQFILNVELEYTEGRLTPETAAMVEHWIMDILPQAIEDAAIDETIF